RLAEGARQQLVAEVLLEPLARAAAGLAAFAFFHLGELLAQQVVDHRRGQDLVLAADGEPDRVVDAVAQRLGVAAGRRHEAARGQLQPADRLERALGEMLVEAAQVEGGGIAVEGEVAEEHRGTGVGPGKSWSRASEIGRREWKQASLRRHPRASGAPATFRVRAVAETKSLGARLGGGDEVQDMGCQASARS